MRIIAGKWRSRLLNAPPGAATRPSADRVRETLFSMLTSRLGSFDGLSVLDLFSGTGAFGFEALSRGAGRALFVEQDLAARRAIEASIKALTAEARVAALDATRLPPAPHPYDLIFLDPPYGKALAPPALQSAAAGGWLAAHSWIALEVARTEDPELDGFLVDARRDVGKARILLLRPA